MNTLRLKVCGLTRQADADACAALGVDFCGFIFHAASPRGTTPQQAATIETPATLRRVGVFVKQSADEVRAAMTEARLDFAQLHGGQDDDFCRTVGPERVIRVFWPDRFADRAALEQTLTQAADTAAWFLLDAGTSGGGSGQTIDWQRLAGLRLSRPWLLAGGLTPENVAEACAVCRPDGVDLNSGVESAPGLKDLTKLRAACAALGRNR